MGILASQQASALQTTIAMAFSLPVCSRKMRFRREKNFRESVTCSSSDSDSRGFLQGTDQFAVFHAGQLYR